MCRVYFDHPYFPEGELGLERLTCVPEITWRGGCSIRNQACLRTESGYLITMLCGLKEGGILSLFSEGGRLFMVVATEDIQGFTKK